MGDIPQGHRTQAARSCGSHTPPLNHGARHSPEQGRGKQAADYLRADGHRVGLHRPDGGRLRIPQPLGKHPESAVSGQGAVEGMGRRRRQLCKENSTRVQAERPSRGLQHAYIRSRGRACALRPLRLRPPLAARSLWEM